MRATYNVRAKNPGARDGIQSVTIQADNVAVMGPFIIFQQEKPLRAVAGQPPPLMVVYVVSSDNLVDIEEVSATPDPLVGELHPDGSVHVPGDHP